MLNLETEAGREGHEPRGLTNDLGADDRFDPGQIPFGAHLEHIKEQVTLLDH